MGKITNKIIWLSLIPTLIIGLGVGIILGVFSGKSDSSSLFAYETTMRNDYDSIARWEVETVVSLLEGVYQQHLSSKMSFEEAKELAASLVRKMKYGSHGYFWIDTRKGLNIVSSVKENEGKNRINSKDARGNFIIKNFIKIAETGGGYSNYWFPKTKGGKALPKRSYVALFEPFNWVVGTGNYVDDIDTAVQEMKDKQVAMLYNLLAIIFVVLIVAVIIIILLGKKIAKPIVVLSEKAKNIANGNLSVQINISSKDEIGVLATSLSLMVTQLRSIVLKIRESADNIVSAGKYMNDASLQMSDVSSSLAESTGQLTQSVEEMSVNIHKNTDNSLSTEKIANKVSDDIQSSSSAVNETSQSMKIITKEISLIDEIAFQTNILALNAEIEAARAGQYGRGFTIVAREVNKLAVRSAEVAKKINSLSHSGVEVANHSEHLLHKLVPEIQKTAVLVKEISQSSKSQMFGAEQISKEIKQLNLLAQQNAALSEETAVNSEELSNQAQQLMQAISLFKI